MSSQHKQVLKHCNKLEQILTQHQVSHSGGCKAQAVPVCDGSDVTLAFCPVCLTK